MEQNPQTPQTATDTATVTVARTSTNVTLRVVDSISTLIRQLIVGVPLIGIGGWWLYKEINEVTPGEKLHQTHLWFAVGLMVLGGIAINPPFRKEISSLVVQFFPNGIPLIGGRRAGDPQPPTPPEEKQP
jgi:hypothetical protein